MAYVRKTQDEWHVQGRYERKWETVTIGETFTEARALLHDYRENESGPFRITLVRARI
jgi:hypothetical protein